MKFTKKTETFNSDQFSRFISTGYYHLRWLEYNFVI